MSASALTVISGTGSSVRVNHTILPCAVGVTPCSLVTAATSAMPRPVEDSGRDGRCTGGRALKSSTSTRSVCLSHRARISASV